MKFPSIEEAIEFFKLRDDVDTSFSNRLHPIYLKDVSITGQAVIFDGDLFLAAFPDRESPKLVLWDYRTGETKRYIGDDPEHPYPIHNIHRAMMLGICPTQVLEHERDGWIHDFWDTVHADLIKVIQYADDKGVFH